MPERQDYAALYEAHDERIDRIITYFSGKAGLRGDDAEDFASWVKTKLIGDDYAVFRKYQGKSALPTYLVAVIANLSKEYRVARQGRWRPSAAARRKGELAMRLERLVHRDGMRWGAAVEVVRTSGETDLPPQQIERMIAELPPRPPLRPVAVDAEVLEATPASSPGADAAVLDEETETVRARAVQALFAAIGRLPPEDQVALRMKYWDGMKVTDVARGTQRDPKQLFKRLDRVMALLRKDLEAAGVSVETVREMMGGLQS
ncbi:MAG TPA: sigma-70 family RNA polymerase sigma factor [Longimicrobiaceae bacterium]|jgi:RNA polymerase sigma factor for flagellar operon FliA|nr:sigma-70 family RNA polymerase sigma factor [Longimicrobiaceae bacterium]